MIWNLKNGTASVKDSEMDYVSFGSGEKTLILLPGLSDGLTTVKGKALLLAYPYKLFFNDYTVYMFSRINEMPDNYSIKEMANDQVTALRNLGIDKVSVVGVSEGGMIAQYMAIDYPEMIDKLVIAVSAPYCNEMLKNALNLWLDSVNKNNHKKLMIDTAELSYSEKYLNGYRKVYHFISLIGKPKNYNRFIINSNAILNFNCLDELNKITCSTLIIGGEKDKIVGKEASYLLNEKINNSRLYMYKNLGHAAYEEAVDFNKRIYDFLSE